MLVGCFVGRNEGYHEWYGWKVRQLCQSFFPYPGIPSQRVPIRKVRPPSGFCLRSDLNAQIRTQSAVLRTARPIFVYFLSLFMIAVLQTYLMIIGQNAEGYTKCQLLSRLSIKTHSKAYIRPYWWMTFPRYSDCQLPRNPLLSCTHTSATYFVWTPISKFSSLS